MNFDEVYKLYDEIKENLAQKRVALIKHNIPELEKIDAKILEIAEEIKKFDLKNTPNNFTDAQKTKLKELAGEIKKFENNNEMLIRHSIDVINGTLSGILNIVQKDKCSYNSHGQNYSGTQETGMSSIIEEA